MEFNKVGAGLKPPRTSVFLLILFCGCATVSPEQRGVYEQGYRAGVGEQMRRIAANFQGGHFPYYHWTQPIVQEVNVPAHVANGVFMPEHKEMVIIQPGEWAVSPAYPVNTQSKESYEHQAQDRNVAVSDITHLPGGVGQKRADDTGPKSQDHP